MAAEGGSARQQAASLRKLAAEARLKAGPVVLLSAQAHLGVAAEQRVARERLALLDWYARWLLADPQQPKAVDVSVLLAPVPTQASYSGSRHAPALPKVLSVKQASPRGERTKRLRRLATTRPWLLSAWRAVH